MAATASIDSIVREALLDRRLTLHYYIEFLTYAMRSLRELNYDILRNTKTVRLTVDEFLECDLPTDYVDWSKVGIEYGKFVIPITQRQSYNNLPKYDVDGTTQIPYSTPNPDLSSRPDMDALLWTYRYNEYGEFTGKFFGGGDFQGYDFKVASERGKILVGSPLQEGSILVLEYIYFDSASATSIVHPYAASTIRAYIDWCYAKNSRRFGLGDQAELKRQYYNEYRILRGRMNRMTLEDVMRLMRKETKQSPKM